jgi:hypothetical protein
MILEKQKQANVLVEGQLGESIGMSLDLDSAQILMQMLSKNLYSDSIGSTIRECASNALDSHRRANVKDPIIVSFVRNSSDNYEFSVEDFGIGLDDDDVKNIISKYGKSTKRNSDTELGMMGLGFKAPLAYTSSFYFVCRKNGVERKYMMYEGEDVNTIDLLYSKPTVEKNGVKIIVPVKWSDKSDFQDKIRQQLAYFENVYFNVDYLDNNFTIHRSELFQFSELNKDTYLHICLDNVYYPLDFEKLGISKIELPIGLRFGLSDKLFPTPNRESLIYTREAKDIIKNKITEFSNYMINKYNENINDSEDVYSILQYYTNDKVNLNILNKNLNISELKKYSTIALKSPKIKGIDNLDLSKLNNWSFSYLLNEYRVVYRYENSIMREVKKNSWGNDVNWKNKHKRHYILNESLKGNKKLYMKDLCSSHTDNIIYFIRKVFKNKLKGVVDNNTYDNILNLRNYPKSKWRAVIKDWQTIESLLLKGTVNVDDITIPQSWLDDRKALRSNKTKSTTSSNNVIYKEDLSGKVAEDLLRYNDGKDCKFVPVRYSVDYIEKDNPNTLFIYTSVDNSMNLDNIYKVLEKMDVKLLIFSDRELEKVNKLNISNLISYETFMKGDNDVFKKIATSLLIKKLFNEHREVFDWIENLKKINSSFSNNIKEIFEYSKNYINLYTIFSNNKTISITNAVQENNKYDVTTLNTYNNVINMINNNNYICTLLKVTKYYNKEEILDCLAQLFVCNGIEINPDYKFLSDIKEEESK